MATKTVRDLEALRDQLIKRRRREAYMTCDDLGVTGHMSALALVHQAIEALDVVIKEGKDEPETDAPSMIG
jgi:hypothetical protein